MQSEKTSVERGMRCVCVAALAALSLAGSAWGQSVRVVPPGRELVAGNGNNLIPLGSSPGGRLLTLYAADQLAEIPAGSLITGLRMRQRNGETAPWPTALANLPDYEIWLAQSARTPGTISTTYADNLLNAVLVRDGAFALAANAYPGGAATGSTPEGWGPQIVFATPYVYKGGVLALEFRSTSAVVPAQFADCENAGAATSAIGSTVSPTAATGIVVGGLIVQLTFVPPSEDLARGVTKVIVGENFSGQSAPGGEGVLIWNSGYTQQSLAAPNQFDTIGPGSDFVGMSWRMWDGSSGAWPLAAVNFTQYDVQLSRSVNSVGAMSTTVATNVGADAVMVRSGALGFALGAFGLKDSEATAPFGPEVGFANIYHYRGGPLLTVTRHSGEVGSAVGFLDALQPGGGGYGSDLRAFQGGGAGSATTASLSGYATTRFSVDAGTSSPLSTVAGPAPSSTGINFFPQVMQIVLSASELKYIPVGSVIDSLWMRVSPGGTNAGAASPAIGVTAADFEVDLSSATAQPASMSGTFAVNQGADNVRVQDGPIGIAAGSLPAATSGQYGKLVQFQKNFVYKGGPLCIKISHAGLTGAFAGPEALSGSAAINNARYSSVFGSGSGVALGAGFDGIAVKLGYIPSVMTPNNLATQEGDGGWSMPSVASATVQVIIPADQLRAVDVGSAITGLSLRHSSTGNPTTFPDTDRVLPRFDVTIAPAANAPLNASTTFANNNGPGVVTVRKGSLSVPKNAFPYSGSVSIPGENAWYVQFDRAYVYTGGDLCVTMRSEGLFSSGANTFDGDGGSPLERGASVYSYSSANELTGFLYGPIGVRLAFTARAFCPWDLNNDGVVSDDDFPIFLSAYNTLDCTDAGMAAGCPADFNYDRVVDDVDFTLFLGAYNTLLCP
ncbi:MAG: hypothetical protein JNK16_14875 [Phycisphaerales bacterium]|nr:hypothetical protein [Phycisphaerales bacterium]